MSACAGMVTSLCPLHIKILCLLLPEKLLDDIEQEAEIYLRVYTHTHTISSECNHRLNIGEAPLM